MHAAKSFLRLMKTTHSVHATGMMPVHSDSCRCAGTAKSGKWHIQRRRRDCKDRTGSATAQVAWAMSEDWAMSIWVAHGEDKRSRTPTPRHCSSRPPLPNHSLTHSLIHSLTHSLPYSVTCSLTHLLARSLSPSFTHSLTHSLTHPFTHSVIYPLPHSLLL